MIRTFRDKATAQVFSGRYVKKLPREIQPRALNKLRLLHSAVTLDDLRVPPVNRLEALKGSRKGQWSIRVNDQWRICFRWNDGQAWDVEIADNH